MFYSMEELGDRNGEAARDELARGLALPIISRTRPLVSHSLCHSAYENLLAGVAG